MISLFRSLLSSFFLPISNINQDCNSEMFMFGSKPEKSTENEKTQANATLEYALRRIPRHSSRIIPRRALIVHGCVGRGK